MYSRKYLVMDFSFEDKFCKHFAASRKCFKVLVSFNIEQCLSDRTHEITISLFYDEKLGVEKEKKLLRSICKKV